MNLLYEDRRLSQPPCKMPRVELDNVRTGFLTKADVGAVTEHLHERVRPIVWFAYYTGWRRGEIVGLRWSQVDFDAGQIRLEPGSTKNRQGRMLPFRALPRLAALLEEQREYTRKVERDKGTVIPFVWHREGRQLKTFRLAWQNATKKAGIGGAWFHDLRRSAVRNLERAGVSRSVATSITGHKTESVFKRYTIVDSVALEEGVAKLARLHEHGRNEERTVVPITEAQKA